MDKHDLSDVDTAILDVLHNGRATKGYLVDQTQYNRNSIYNRLEVLQAAGHIHLVHDATRLFELVTDPRDTTTEE